MAWRGGPGRGAQGNSLIAAIGCIAPREQFPRFGRSDQYSSRATTASRKSRKGRKPDPVPCGEGTLAVPAGLALPSASCSERARVLRRRLRVDAVPPRHQQPLTAPEREGTAGDESEQVTLFHPGTRMAPSMNVPAESNGGLVRQICFFILFCSDHTTTCFKAYREPPGKKRTLRIKVRSFPCGVFASVVGFSSNVLLFFWIAL